MDVHRAVIPDILIAPHHIEQVLPAVHPARIAQKQLHQVELLGGELHRDAVPPSRPAAGVQPDVSRRQHAVAAHVFRRPRPAQQRPHPGLQLQQVEGLGDVVVRAALKAHDLIGVLPLSGQHDDRDIGELPDAHAGLEAVDLGHHQVQQDQVKAPLPGQLHRLLAVITHLHLIAFVLQVELDALYQHLLVVYY